MSNALAPVKQATPARVSLGTLQAEDAGELIRGASEIAKELAAVVKSRKLSSNIQGREYVRCEGWTTLAALLGVVAREVDNTVDKDGVYTATVELVRINDGAIVGRASAECGRGEPMWAKRPHFARRSMASTRATGKACRLAFSWIMALSGYEPTPAEEMDHVNIIETSPVPPVRAPVSSTDEPTRGTFEGYLVDSDMKTKGTKTWWVFTAHDGQTYISWSATLAGEVEQCVGNDTHITFVWKTNKKGFREIVQVVRTIPKEENS